MSYVRLRIKLSIKLYMEGHMTTKSQIPQKLKKVRNHI